ncbi:hypothetical protein FPSE_00273 [Fusarium pseudograminearum CS3096]|uniref:Apple domain-containing protein n=1 Tax=Fusarium pseudograminearum (strain CS3096) TaxID=1028729 RepID=K3VWM7_FUSPC|nr:hypothetical protein FPSE_00273 [Fusarium pseudograminearum CS3096]EKJ79588.1 hypothetical protein FPSE_00273 [Fusarium pseudograminearum CS3096]
MTMTQSSFVLFVITGLAMAGLCKSGSSTVQISEVIVSSLETSSSMVPIETSTVEATSAPTTDTYTSTNGETMTISSTKIDSDTTLTTTVASLSSSETSSELATATTAAVNNPAECIGSIRIQHDHYIGISGGLKGPLSWNDCAQLCEDTSTCIAFLQSQSGWILLECCSGRCKVRVGKSGLDQWHQRNMPAGLMSLNTNTFVCYNEK